VADPVPHRAYAGLVSRLAALVIDITVISLAVGAVRLLPPVAWEQLFPEPAPAWLTGGCAVIAALLPWSYFAGSWWLTSQTVGDLVIGLLVLRPDGGRLALPHAALRAAIGLLLAPLWMIGMVPILWDHRRRAWHDVVLRSVVRYAPKAHHPAPQR
jgi:uncharacterized RDD family membrane protein YckC